MQIRGRSILLLFRLYGNMKYHLYLHTKEVLTFEDLFQTDLEVLMSNKT